MATMATKYKDMSILVHSPIERATCACGDLFCRGGADCWLQSFDCVYGRRP